MPYALRIRKVYLSDSSYSPIAEVYQKEEELVASGIIKPSFIYKDLISLSENKRKALEDPAIQFYFKNLPFPFFYYQMLIFEAVKVLMDLRVQSLILKNFEIMVVLPMLSLSSLKALLDPRIQYLLEQEMITDIIGIGNLCDAEIERLVDKTNRQSINVR